MQTMTPKILWWHLSICDLCKRVKGNAYTHVSKVVTPMYPLMSELKPLDLASHTFVQVLIDSSDD